MLNVPGRPGVGVLNIPGGGNGVGGGAGSGIDADDAPYELGVWCVGVLCDGVTDVKFGGPNSVQTLGSRRLSRQFGDIMDSVNAISGSTESQGEVTVRLQNSGRVVNGVGADPDIIVASAKAYLSALNKLQSKADRVAAQG